MTEKHAQSQGDALAEAVDKATTDLYAACTSENVLSAINNLNLALAAYRAASTMPVRRGYRRH